MKFEIEQPRLLAALTMANTVADRRKTMPVLANVLLRAHDGAVDITATDMMVTSAETLECTVFSRGSITVDARHLRNIVSTLSGAVVIESVDNDWVQVSSGRTVFKIHGLAASEFPELPDVPGSLHACNGAKLEALIDATLYSVSTDEARLNLNGAWFSAVGCDATMVSTDGHRLSVRRVELDDDLGDLFAAGVVIPRKGIEEIRRALRRDAAKTTIGCDGDYLFVDTPSLMLCVKLSKVTFPPWKRVVPKDHTRRVDVDRSEMIAGLRSALVIAPEKTGTVELTIDGDVVTLRADNPERGTTTLEIDAKITGTSMRAGFNAAYILDALQVLVTERVWLEFTGDLDPMLIRRPDDDGMLAVVMPMRI